MLRILIAVLTLLFIHSNSFSQHFSIPEVIKSRCKDIPLNSRVKVTVSDFAYSAGGTRGNTLENFAAMLSNAMFQINCFRVLSMRKDDDQLEGGGRVLTPEIVVTGEITEYSHSTKTSSMIIATKKEITAHIGYVIQVKNNFTGDILFSESRNVEGSSENSSLQMKVTTPKSILSRVGSGTVGSSTEGDNINAAYQDALEKAIIEAVELLVNKYERIITDLEGNRAEDFGPVANLNSQKTEIKIQGAQYSNLVSLENKYKSSSWVQETKKSLSSGMGRLEISHTGNQEDIINIILTFGSKYEITGLTDTEITIREIN